MDKVTENKSIPAMPEELKRIYLMGFFDGRRFKEPFKKFVNYRVTISNTEGANEQFDISSGEMVGTELDSVSAIIRPGIEEIPFWPEINLNTSILLEGISSVKKVRPLKSRPLQIQCRNCQEVWSPQILPGGFLASDWWECPKGCNSEE